MRGPASIVLLLVTAFAFAGCAQEPAAPKTDVSASTTAPPAVPDAEFGSITGVVTDDENAPLSRVRVSVVELATTAETDAAGRYTFNNMTPGTYSLIAERLGYESGGKKVEVVAGEVAKADFLLAAFVVADEPYILTVPRSAFINFGLYASDIVQRTVNDTSLNSITCANCKMPVHYSKGAIDLLLEGKWTRGAAVPAVNEQIDLDWNIPSGNGWAYYTTGLMKSGQRVFATETAIKEYGKHDRIMLEVGAALGGGVMFQQKMDFYFSFGYGMKIEEYTALPPS